MTKITTADASSKFKVIIAGGRDFKDYDMMCRHCDMLLEKKENVEIVSGNAKGADEMGEKYAVRNKHTVSLFPANWNDIHDRPAAEIGETRKGHKYWKLAGHYRNMKMAMYADALIAFWDGKSKGTKDMINQSKSRGLKVRVVNY